MKYLATIAGYLEGVDNGTITGFSVNHPAIQLAERAEMRRRVKALCEANGFEYPEPALLTETKLECWFVLDDPMIGGSAPDDQR